MYYIVKIAGVEFSFESGDGADAFIEKIVAKYGLVLHREAREV